MKIQALLALLVTVVLVGCGATPIHDRIAPPPAAEPVAPAAKVTSNHADKTVSLVQTIATWVSKQSDAAFAKFKPYLEDAIAKASAEATASQSSAHETVAVAERRDVENTALRKALEAANRQTAESDAALAKANTKIQSMNHDSIRGSLLIALGLCVLAAAFGGFLLFKGDVSNGVGLLGGGGLGVFLCIFAISFQAAIGWTIAIVALCGLGVGVYFAYQKLHGNAGSIVQSVQAVIESGKLKLDEAKGIFNAVQTPGAKKLVDQHTPNVG